MTRSDADVADVVAGMLHAVDDLDWDAFRGSCAAKLATDYTSLWGGEPEELDADQLAAAWQQFAPGYDATQHLIGPVVVTHADDQTATCTTNVRAYHHVVDAGEAATWMVAGRYVVALDRTPPRAGRSAGSRCAWRTRKAIERSSTWSGSGCPRARAGGPARRPVWTQPPAITRTFHQWATAHADTFR